MDRRRFLTGAGLFLAAGGLPLGRAQGRAPKGVNGGGFYRFRVGRSEEHTSELQSH